MAEGGGLLNRYTVNSRIVGSNPIPSATFPSIAVHYRPEKRRFPAILAHHLFASLQR